MFKDPIAVKNEKPKDSKKCPFDFDCLQYDNRSGSFINAGTHYGVGHTNPLGHMGNPKQSADVLPKGRALTIKVDERG